MTVNGETRMALFQHPPCVVDFAPLRLGRRPCLRLGLGIKQVAWERIRSPVRFLVSASGRWMRSRLLLDVTLDPHGNPEHRCWIDREIDLGAYVGRRFVLRLETALANGADASYCWSGWSDPLIVHEIKPAIPRRQRASRHPNVLLITADALRADHLGCYGSQRVQTPQLDQLAREGCLFEHSRAQSSTTLGSYASLMTSRYCSEHGINAEWGTIPATMKTLPNHFAECGYETVIVGSEAELTEANNGITNRFAHSVPCLARPAQDGAMTIRQFSKWLDTRSHQPFFAWVQLFDAHPPCRPVEPFASMYYEGDPCDYRRRFRTDLVQRIHGVESCVDFDIDLDRTSLDAVPTTLIERLLQTAQALVGRTVNGPDLATHLWALGPSACRGLEPSLFGDWLLRQARALADGVWPPELKGWLQELRPLLRGIEAEIVSWLDGVVDFRFPLAQYMSQVSYLDHLVGKLLEELKTRALYDSTCIVFTSPHGEVLDETDLPFHHHALLECVLRTPMLLKPARTGPGVAPAGRRIGGVFDAIDLFPTLAEGLQLPTVPGLRGTSRWQHVVHGGPIDEHDSYSEDIHTSMVAIARPPHLFLKTLRTTRCGADWAWEANRHGLFRLSVPMSYQEDLTRTNPSLMRAFEHRFQTWIDQLGQARSPTLVA